MSDANRRDVLTGRAAAETLSARARRVLEGDFFDSFESASAFLAEAGPLLHETARGLGIDTAGKDDLTLAREIQARATNATGNDEHE
jgi:hypothetical protein